MSIPILTANNVKIYNITGHSHHRLPDWLIRRHSKKLKKDSAFSKRIQLIQDFEFPEASLHIAFTGDQQHVVACGTYKPQFRVFELAEASLKFERHTASETVTMQLLGEDWRKIVLLQSDRYIEFHSSSGLYHSARIPKMGRDMTYDWTTCDLLMGASSSELYRLNLDRGQFMAPLETCASAVNCVRISPLHGLYGLACDNSSVEFWDRRDRRQMGVISIERSLDFFVPCNTSSSLEVTALQFMPDGIHWAAGTSDGRVLLFDLRTHRPLDVRDHYNGFAIKKIDYHASTGTLVSADKRSLKLWRDQAKTIGENRLFTVIESEMEINDFAMQEQTGLILVANEGSPISSYFIPSLGPAPRWCSFLENLTEEMEENDTDRAKAVYDNFKFVTKIELAQLGLDHLIGSNLLRAYMHGYFINLKLYEKAKAIANPFAYEEYLTRKRAEKLDKERQSRIKAADPVYSAKVNRDFAVKLSADSQDPNDNLCNDKKNRTRDTAVAILKDDRFAELFKDPDFEIDKNSIEFRQIHPAHHKKQ